VPKTNPKRASGGKKKKVASLKSFWEGVEETFKSKVKGIRALLRHQASGAAIEEYFRELLCSYLPRRYIVEPGFVVTGTGQMSDYIDLLVVDAFHIPPLCNDPPVRIFAAEAVVAAIEITAAPLGKVKRANLGTIPKFQDDVLKLATVREMSRVRKYSDFFPIANADATKIALKQFEVERTLSPRTVLITCGEEGSRKKYEQTLLAALQAAHGMHNHVWLHLAYSLKHGLYRFRAYTNFESRHTDENALLEFLLRLNHLLSTYQTYRTDITRYRPSLREDGDDLA
jgi:hypothetical protein